MMSPLRVLFPAWKRKKMPGQVELDVCRDVAQRFAAVKRGGSGFVSRTT